MRFGGYWVVLGEGKATLTRASFDETELDPATQWKEALQNQEHDGLTKGYVELESALICAAEHLGKLAGTGLENPDRPFGNMVLPDLTLGV